MAAFDALGQEEDPIEVFSDDEPVVDRSAEDDTEDDTEDEEEEEEEEEEEIVVVARPQPPQVPPPAAPVPATVPAPAPTPAPNPTRPPLATWFLSKERKLACLKVLEDGCEKVSVMRSSTTANCSC